MARIASYGSAPPVYPAPLVDQHVWSDGGPWATHDVACAVCGDNKAILNVNEGVFEPCGTCRRAGWQLVKKRSHWWSF